MRRALALALAGAACGGGGGGPTISVTHAPAHGAGGAPEAIVVDASGAVTARAGFTGHADVDFADGDVLTIAVSRDGAWALATYYGLAPGDAITTTAGLPDDPASGVAVDVQLPTGPTGATVALSVPGMLSTGAPGAHVTVHLPQGTTAAPMLAYVAQGQTLVGTYGGKALDVTGGHVTLDQAVTATSVTFSDSKAPGGAALTPRVAVYGGDLAIASSGQAPAGALPVPDGFDRVELTAGINDAGARRDDAASLDGAPPAQLDAGQGPIAPGATATIDPTGLRWTAAAPGAALTTWSYSAGQGQTWTLYAPAALGDAPTVKLPSDVASGVVWGATPIDFSLAIGDGAGATYLGWVGDPAWMQRSGAHRWSRAYAPVTR